MFRRYNKKLHETNKHVLRVYFTLRILVLITMITQILEKNYSNAALCLATLLMYTVPTIVKDRLKITLPSTLEIIIYCMIFAGEILGEVNNFFKLIPYWDTILHTIDGFLFAGVGFSLVDLLNNNSNDFNLSPIYITIVAFCFSMTIGIIWEFFEFSMDRYFNLDMQKDRIVQTISSVKINPTGENVPIIVKDIEKTEIISKEGKTIIEGGYLELGIIDTMKDLFVNLIGALTFSIIGYIALINRNTRKFATNFIPSRYNENLQINK